MDPFIYLKRVVDTHFAQPINGVVEMLARWPVMAAQSRDEFQFTVFDHYLAGCFDAGTPGET